MRFNTDVVFIDASGQVRVLQGDLTLRANGDGHIIIGSGLTLRPEADCRSLEPVDLGLDYLRWATVFACSGNFLERPTVNDQGVLLQSEAVDSINGLSGVVILASGTTNLIEISTSGEHGIIFNIDPARLEDNLTLSGISKLETAEEVAFQSSTSTTLVEVLSLGWTVPSSGIYRTQWSFQGACSQANKECEFRIQLDNSTLINDLMDIQTSFNVAAGSLQFGGFAQFGVDTGAHSVDFEFRFADTGGGAVEVENLRLEVLRVT